MAGYDVIGDVHGHVEQLTALLRQLGYREKHGTWCHEERTAVFVGDIIDRRRDVELEDLGGFLSLRSPRAAEVQSKLAERGVSVDYRDEFVRFGPAPYLSDRQLDDTIAALAETVAELH